MCGRYAITTAPEAMRRVFGYGEMPNFPARYNVAPTQPIPVVFLADGARRFALMRWGLLPAWVKDPKAFTLLINGRGDTINDKPAFKNAMKRRRCLIPADGFYEWKREGKVNQPYFIRRKDRAPFAFAGLWETWTGPNGEELDTAAIVTTDANAALAHIHHRMPVILPEGAWDLWLDCARADALMAAEMSVPAQSELFESYPVSPAVNKAAHDDPALIERAEPMPQPAEPEKKPRAKAKKIDVDQPTLF